MAPSDSFKRSDALRGLPHFPATPKRRRAIALISPAQPGPPTGLTGTAVSSCEIDLSWTAPSGRPPVVGYNVYRASSSGYESPGAATLVNWRCRRGAL
jgi:hypothetical protein